MSGISKIQTKIDRVKILKETSSFDKKRVKMSEIVRAQSKINNAQRFLLFNIEISLIKINKHIKGVRNDIDFGV